MGARSFPFFLLAAVSIAALGLASVIVRNPDTHGHLWGSVPYAYHRTPVEEVPPADLDSIQAKLVPFSFPTPPAAQNVAVKEMPAEGHQGMAAEAQVDKSTVQKIVLKQTEYGFDIPEVRLTPGVPVELVVVNEGKQVHGIWVPDFAISQEIRSGKSRSFSFTPKTPGRIRFTCSYNLCGTDEEHARMVGYFVIA